MQYYIELVRIYHVPEHIWDETIRVETELGETDDWDEAVKIMSQKKLKHGKTFEEEVHISKLDEHGDIINYPYMRDRFDKRYPNE